MSNLKKAFLATIGFCFCYGLQLVLMQFYLKSKIEPIHLNFLTNLTAFLIMSVYFYFFSKDGLSFKLNKKSARLFFTATLLWISADILVNFGLKLSTSINMSVISRLQIFITYLLTAFLFKESLTRNKTLSVVFSFIGAVVVVYNFNSKIILNPGDLMFLFFTIAISLSGVLRQKITGDGLSPFKMTYLMFAVSSFVLGTVTFVFFPLKNIEAPLFIIFNALIGLTGFMMVNYAIAKGGATFFSIGSSLLPFVTALFSSVILKQLPQSNQIIGALIIISGVFLFQKK